MSDFSFTPDAAPEATPSPADLGFSFTPDAPAGESFTPGVNAAAFNAAKPLREQDNAAIAAKQQFDQLNAAEGQKGVLLSNGQTTMPNPKGKFVRPEGASPTDSMNGSQFVPDHVPGYDPKTLGITNPVTGKKELLPDWAQPTASKIADFGIGVADTLSSAIALPVDGLINAFRGSIGQDIFANPASSKEVMSKWMTDHGIPNTSQQAFDDWWSNLGSTAATQGLLSLALVAGAGPLAAGGKALSGAGETLAGAGVGPISGAFTRNVGGLVSDVGSAATKVGEMAQSQPGQVLAGDAGATALGAGLPGLSDTLQRHGVTGVISDPTVLGYIGSIVGGLIGAPIAGMGMVRPGLTRGVKEGMSAANEAFGGLPRFGGKAARSADLSNVPNSPIINLTERSFNPSEIAHAVNGYQDQVSSWIEDKMAALTQGAKNPAVAADRVVQMMDQAWKKATAIRNSMYKGVDQSGTFDPSPIQKAAQDLTQKVVGDAAQSRFLPSDIINEMLTDPHWMQKSGGGYNLGVKTPVTYSPVPISIDRARQIQQVLGSRIAEARKTPGTQQVVANMVQLSNAISDTMDAAFPQNFALKKANEFSRWMHTRFDMGATGQMGQVRMDDAALQDSRQAMSTGMRNSKFGTALQDIGTKLGNDPAVAQRVDTYLRSQVQDIANNATDPLLPAQIADAKAAAVASKYLRSPDFQQFSKAFTTVGPKLQQQATALNDELIKQREISKSRFFSLAGNDPEKAAEALTSSGTKLQDAAMITRVLGSDRDARDAIQFAVIRKLGQSVEWDPGALKSLINSKDNKSMLQTLMGHNPGQFDRMQNVIDAMTEFQGGPLGSRAGRLKTVVKTSGRIIGLVAARFLGAKSIQSHAIGAQMGSSVLSDIFNIIPPDAMLANALVDPRWERFALSKVPANMEDFNRTSKILGALVGGIHAGHSQLMNQTEQDNGQQ